MSVRWATKHSRYTAHHEANYGRAVQVGLANLVVPEGDLAAGGGLTEALLVSSCNDATTETKALLLAAPKRRTATS